MFNSIQGSDLHTSLYDTTNNVAHILEDIFAA